MRAVFIPVWWMTSAGVINSWSHRYDEPRWIAFFYDFFLCIGLKVWLDSLLIVVLERLPRFLQRTDLLVLSLPQICQRLPQEHRESHTQREQP